MKQKSAPVVQVCPDERLLTEQEAAAVLGVSVFFLQKHRTEKKPRVPYVRISHRCVRYVRSDLMQWAASLRVNKG